MTVSGENFQHFSRISYAQAAKESEFHHLTIALIDSPKPGLCLVYCVQIAAFVP